MLLTAYIVTNRYAYTQSDPNPFVYVAYVLGSAGLNGTIHMLSRKTLLPTLRHSQASRLALNGLLGLVANGLFIWGQQSTTSINTSFLAAGAMITTAAIAAVWKLDSYTPTQVAWFLAMFVGIYLAVVGFDLLEPNKGDVLILASLPIFGFMNVYAKLLTNEFEADVVANSRFVVNAVAALVFIALLGNGLALSGSEIFYAYVSGTAFWLSIIFFYRAIKFIGPNLGIVMQRTSLVFTLFAAVILLSEELEILDVIGAAIIIVCVTMMNLKSERRKPLVSEK